MKRRSKMFSRAVFWTLGTLLGYAINAARGSETDVACFVFFWTGMMVAATFVHFDPPEVETWERGA